MHCGNPLHSDAITSGVGFLSGTNNWFIIIITVVVGIFLLITLYCVLTFSRRCRKTPQNNQKETITLNSNIHPHLEMQNIKVNTIANFLHYFSLMINISLSFVFFNSEDQNYPT